MEIKSVMLYTYTDGSERRRRGVRMEFIVLDPLEFIFIDTLFSRWAHQCPIQVCAIC